MQIFNRKWEEKERVKKKEKEEEESLEKYCIITIFLQFSLPNMLWLEFGDSAMLQLQFGDEKRRKRRTTKAEEGLVRILK